MPDISYATLTADEVEQAFMKKDRTLSYFTKKYSMGVDADGEDGGEDGSKVKRKSDGSGLVCIYVYILL